MYPEKKHISSKKHYHHFNNSPMKTNTSKLILATLILSLSVSIKVSAFEYKINFTASGATYTIESIVVLNITQGTTVTIPAGSDLNLTAVKHVLTYDESLQIYPNPVQGKASVSFYSKHGGNTQINVFGLDGKTLLGKTQKLDAGYNHFQISLPSGVFTIQINENGLLHNAKIVSLNSGNKTDIVFTGNDKTETNSTLKSKNTVISFSYNIDDLLLFKAYSGNYTTILSDIVTGSKTINFNFVECKDADGNYYPTVTIGNQVWMAENLKTSQYRNNIAIPNYNNASYWGTLTTDACCDYSTPSNSTTYGKLYNWYSLTKISNLAPIGWHTPTDAEWTALTDFLGGSALAGIKLKETGNTHWTIGNSTATNESGFNALPGGSRSTDGSFYDIGSIGYWWSESEGSNINSGWYRYIAGNFENVSRGNYSKSGGMSVRCVMGDLPVLSTASNSEITASSSKSGGNISFDGNMAITERGVCWSTLANPTIIDSKTNDGYGTGEFSSSITGLALETIYYIRAYATNSFGTGYGAQQSFSTKLATLTTSSASALTINSATCGGNVTAIGGAAVSSRGVCWSTSPGPTTALSTTISAGSGTGLFTANLTGLTLATKYYVRAYAINPIGTSYGNEISFTTQNGIPTLTTTTASSILAFSATTGGNITNDGGTPVTAKGVCYSTSTAPTIENSTVINPVAGLGLFVSNLTGLIQSTKYYIRAYATNVVGTAYGNEVSFTSQNGLPVLTSTTVSSILAFSGTSGGNISADGGKTVTARGICWSLNSNPTIELTTKTIDGAGNGSFVSYMTELAANTRYYIRSYATNSIGTSYGNEISFITQNGVISLTTASITNLMALSSTSGGIITTDGGTPVITRGICWSINPSPTIELATKTIDGSGIGSFVSNLIGLAASTKYHIRSYATNAVGTCYGNELNFTTQNGVIVLTTTSIAYITANSASCGGDITSYGGSAVITRGVCWSINQNPTISDYKTDNGSGSGTYTSSISGINAETIYYVRSYATNGVNTYYGNPISFSTKLPVLTTNSIVSVKATTADCGGNISDIGGSSVITRGICWSISPNPTTELNSKTIDGSGTGTFTSFLIGLTIGTKYYVRAYATSSIGTAYGNENSFTVAAMGSIFENGYVFYLDGNGHGMICALTDLSTIYPWSKGGYPSPPRKTNATGSTVGTGKSNTLKIISIEGSSGSYAAYACYNLTPVGVWFLPSRAELLLIYTNLKKNGIGGFIDTYYWTSTECPDSYGGGYGWLYAESNSFNIGYSSCEDKTDSRNVRAVRDF